MAPQRGGEASSHSAVSREGREPLPDVPKAGKKVRASAWTAQRREALLTLLLVRVLLKAVLAAWGRLCPGDGSATGLEPREEPGIGQVTKTLPCCVLYAKHPGIVGWPAPGVLLCAGDQSPALYRQHLALEWAQEQVLRKLPAAPNGLEGPRGLVGNWV